MTRAFLTIKTASKVLRFSVDDQVYVGENPYSYPFFSIYGKKIWGHLLEWRYLKDYTAPKSRVELLIEPLKEDPGPWLEKANFLEFGSFVDHPLVPIEEWGALSEEQLEELDRLEKHIRQEILQVLASHEEINIVYDSQCSTGKCIYEVAKAFPEVRCFASDISSEMVAKTRLTCSSFSNVEAFQKDATKPFSQKVDAMILRGLGIHVVSREEALQIVKNTWEALGENGLMICPSLVPMHVCAKDLEEIGFKVLSTSAWNDKLQIRFPFLLAKK